MEFLKKLAIDRLEAIGRYFMFLWRLPIILKKLEDHVEAVKARESEPECPRCKTPATFVEETPAFDVIYRERRYWCTKCGYRTARLHKIMVA